MKFPWSKEGVILCGKSKWGKKLREKGETAVRCEEGVWWVGKSNKVTRWRSGHKKRCLEIEEQQLESISRLKVEKRRDKKKVRGKERMKEGNFRTTVRDNLPLIQCNAVKNENWVKEKRKRDYLKLVGDSKKEVEKNFRREKPPSDQQ